MSNSLSTGCNGFGFKRKGNDPATYDWRANGVTTNAAHVNYRDDLVSRASSRGQVSRSNSRGQLASRGSTASRGGQNAFGKSTHSNPICPDPQLAPSYPFPGRFSNRVATDMVAETGRPFARMDQSTFRSAGRTDLGRLAQSLRPSTGSKTLTTTGVLKAAQADTTMGMGSGMVSYTYRDLGSRGRAN